MAQPLTQAQTIAMGQAAVHVDNAGQELAGLRTAVETAVSGSTAGWQTSAADTYRGLMNNWIDEFTKIINDLQTIHEKLVGTQTQYAGAMTAEQDGVSRLAALLSNTSA